MSFKINRVYTRSGDDGRTGLVGGTRVSKCSCQVESYGDIDELNSVIGTVKEECGGKPLSSLRPLLEFLQQELFDLGAELACEPEVTYPGKWLASASHVTKLEELCDHFGADLPELDSFVLPGGSRAAAALHVARTVARRAERRLVSWREERLSQGLAFNDCTVQYVNRLSDLLFVLARWALKSEGKDAPLWVREDSRSLPTLPT